MSGIDDRTALEADPMGMDSRGGGWQKRKKGLSVMKREEEGGQLRGGKKNGGGMCLCVFAFSLFLAGQVTILSGR